MNEPAASADAPLLEKPVGPQFGVIHLMVLMAAVGVLMIPSRQIIQVSGLGPDRTSYYMTAYSIFNSIIDAVPLALNGFFELRFDLKAERPLSSRADTGRYRFNFRS